MTAPVSVFIITRNEAARLGRTLVALEWADEVVVVDSGSTDATIEIARAAGARVIERDWPGYGPQKVFAEAQCRNDWVLNVDADEVVSPGLAREIQAAAEGPPGAFRIHILNVYPGDAEPRPWANDYNVVRFYHRSVAGYRDHPLFDRVEVSGGEKQLSQTLHHHPLVSLHHFVEKENTYSTFAAMNAAPKSRTYLLIRLVFEMPLAFFKFYLLRRHITGGWKGFAFSLTAAFARTLRLAKMLERQEISRRSKISDQS